MQILVLTTNEYGQRFVQNLEECGPDAWEVSGYSYERKLPVVLDDPAAFVPKDLPASDLFLYVGQNRQLAEMVPDIAEACAAKAVIAGVDVRGHLPTGLANQLRRDLSRRGIDSAFPVPFCSLYPSQGQHPFIREFAEHFGRASFRLQVAEGRIRAAEVLRGAPCGNSAFVAQRLIGVEEAHAVEQTGRFFHAHPCMASMEMDPEIGDTILHVAGYHAKGAVRRALGRARNAAENHGESS